MLHTFGICADIGYEAKISVAPLLKVEQVSPEEQCVFISAMAIAF
jgi:hypothetical protein